ncbi:hypothetical protein BDEG_27156 [Batrachochytrium dendrobatidis JEL423]|uniref:Uncharacterized protein n=1 Tax=Batrachochytrium dendrobatidis (strain JEL423) TaxID=403673 RepID=A0A177WVA9_BATDL|nr:hypothetical protein BDEG_27156 [Batrachochytrium dendrobatidis JEL423]
MFNYALDIYLYTREFFLMQLCQGLVDIEVVDIEVVDIEVVDTVVVDIVVVDTEVVDTEVVDTEAVDTVVVDIVVVDKDTALGTALDTASEREKVVHIASSLISSSSSTV